MRDKITNRINSILRHLPYISLGFNIESRRFSLYIKLDTVWHWYWQGSRVSFAFGLGFFTGHFEDWKNNQNNQPF
jgi:hypothetical protein